MSNLAKTVLSSFYVKQIAITIAKASESANSSRSKFSLYPTIKQFKSLHLPLENQQTIASCSG